MLSKLSFLLSQEKQYYSVDVIWTFFRFLLSPHGGLCFVQPIFRFWFLVTFGDEVTEILCNLCLNFARQDVQDGKKPERKSHNLSDQITINQKTLIYVFRWYPHKNTYQNLVTFISTFIRNGVIFSQPQMKAGNAVLF